MKKKFTLFVAAVMAASLLTACGDKANDNSSEEVSAAAETSEASGAVTETAESVDLSALETITLKDINLEDYLTLGEYLLF